ISDTEYQGKPSWQKSEAEGDAKSPSLVGNFSISCCFMGNAVFMFILSHDFQVLYRSIRKGRNKATIKTDSIVKVLKAERTDQIPHDRVLSLNRSNFGLYRRQQIRQCRVIILSHDTR